MKTRKLYYSYIRVQYIPLQDYVCSGTGEQFIFIHFFSTSWPTEVPDILYVFWNEVLHEMWQK